MQGVVLIFNKMLDIVNKIFRCLLIISLLYLFCLSTILSAQKFDSEALYREANEFYRNSNYEKAKKIYKEIIERDTEFVKAYYGLGSVYYIEKDFNTAIEFYKKAIEKNDKFAEAYEWLGNSYEKLNNYQEAVKNWEKSLEIKPNNPHLQKKLASFYKKSKSQQKNISEIIKLAYNLKNEDYHKKAINVLEQGVKNYPNSVELWFALSRIYFEMRKFKGTLKCWEKILQLGQSLSLNALLLPGEKIEQYLEEVDGMVGIFNKDPIVYKYAGMVYLNNTENYKQAIYLFEQSIVLKDKQKDAYLALAEAYLRDKQKDKAVEIYEKLLKIYDDIEANYRLGIYYLYDKSDLKKAKVYLTKVKNSNPKYKDIEQIYKYMSRF